MGKEAFLVYYEIGDYNNLQELLYNVCRKRGKLLKGGVCDYDSGAKLILKDIMNGSIKYFTSIPGEAEMEE